MQIRIFLFQMAPAAKFIKLINKFYDSSLLYAYFVFLTREHLIIVIFWPWKWNLP